MRPNSINAIILAPSSAFILADNLIQGHPFLFDRLIGRGLNKAQNMPPWGFFQRISVSTRGYQHEMRVLARVPPRRMASPCPSALKGTTYSAYLHRIDLVLVGSSFRVALKMLYRNWLLNSKERIC
jgi:hypothetical protein